MQTMIYTLNITVLVRDYPDLCIQGQVVMRVLHTYEDP